MEVLFRNLKNDNWKSDVTVNKMQLLVVNNYK